MAKKEVAVGGTLQSKGEVSTDDQAQWDAMHPPAGARDAEAAASESDEPHWKWRRLQAQFGGTITRRKVSDGPVVLTLTYGDGDATTARGETNAIALDLLIEKMGGLK